MKPFVRLKAVAAPFPIANVDTDMIIPAAFLKTVSRTGLGKGLFYAARFDGAGKLREDCLLNREPWSSAGILVALENFGCGSSREHAPWALLDFGISCVIAPSFADIFRNNCYKNCILPIALPPVLVATLMADASLPDSAIFSVDLEQRTITRGNGDLISFTIADEPRRRLLSGADDISATLAYEKEIAIYEAMARGVQRS